MTLCSPEPAKHCGVSDAIDEKTFKSVLRRLCSGVTVVTTETGNGIHGMTATAMAALSLRPPLVLVCVANSTRMNSFLSRARLFGLSILSDRQSAISDHFANIRGTERICFDRCREVPVIDGAIAQIASEIVTKVLEGDHTIYVGKVIGCRTAPGNPLVYYAGAYKELSDRDV